MRKKVSSLPIKPDPQLMGAPCLGLALGLGKGGRVSKGS